jgi:hypothetical protein
MYSAHLVTPDIIPPVRTTLLALVQSLTKEGLMPEDVVRVAHESIDRGRIVLTGTFRDGFSPTTPDGRRKANLP